MTARERGTESDNDARSRDRPPDRHRERPMETTKRGLAGIVTPAGVGALVLLAHTVGSLGFEQEPAPAGDGPTVTRAEVEHWKRELTNWGRWGAGDESGTLNLITPEKRKQAAALVREGISVSLAHDAETEATVDGPRPYQVIRWASPPTRSRLVPRIHPHASRLPEPQLHRRRRDLQRLPAGPRGGRGAGRPLQEHRAQRQVGHRHAGRAHRHGAVPRRALPGTRHADHHRGHRGLGGGHRGNGFLR